MTSESTTPYVQVSKFCELTGYTKWAVHGKIRDGVWIEGKHYRHAPDGHILLHLREYERWVEGQR